MDIYTDSLGFYRISTDIYIDFLGFYRISTDIYIDSLEFYRIYMDTHHCIDCREFCENCNL